LERRIYVSNSETGGSSYTLKIGKRAFLAAFFILLSLMVASGILTRIVPSGRYNRLTENGHVVVDPNSFHYVEKPNFPVYRWFTAPIEVVFSKDSLTIITIILLIIFIGGAFTILDKAGVLKALLAMIVRRFRNNRFLLLAVVVFFFMFAGAFLGIFEALVPLVVMIIPLAYLFGWDSLTGLGMSLLALGFGFSAAVTNPFTIGVAQTIAELPLFSGAWLRIIFFMVIYATVLLFLLSYVRRIEKNPEFSPVYREDLEVRKNYSSGQIEEDSKMAELPEMRRAVVWFAIVIGFAIVFIFVTARIPSVSFLAFPVMGLLFLIAGIGSGLLAGLGLKDIGRYFVRGFIGIFPGIVLILMAMSVKYIISSGGIMDTILYRASIYISHTSKFFAALLIYALTLFLNFFIGSASAKAFLMMPILAPLADIVGITRQTAILAFDFGDGFSNLLYPSNALLLIGLSFTVVSYPKWFRWVIKLQLIVFVITLVFLGIAVAINFGPF